jgi:hypothetical protein
VLLSPPGIGDAVPGDELAAAGMEAFGALPGVPRDSVNV